MPNGEGKPVERPKLFVERAEGAGPRYYSTHRHGYALTFRKAGDSSYMAYFGCIFSFFLKK